MNMYIVASKRTFTIHFTSFCSICAVQPGATTRGRSVALGSQLNIANKSFHFLIKRNKFKNNTLKAIAGLTTSCT